MLLVLINLAALGPAGSSLAVTCNGALEPGELCESTVLENCSDLLDNDGDGLLSAARSVNTSHRYERGGANTFG